MLFTLFVNFFFFLEGKVIKESILWMVARIKERDQILEKEIYATYGKALL